MFLPLPRPQLLLLRKLGQCSIPFPPTRGPRRERAWRWRGEGPAPCGAAPCCRGGPGDIGVPLRPPSGVGACAAGPWRDCSASPPCEAGVGHPAALCGPRLRPWPGGPPWIAISSNAGRGAGLGAVRGRGVARCSLFITRGGDATPGVASWPACVAAARREVGRRPLVVALLGGPCVAAGVRRGWFSPPCWPRRCCLARSVLVALLPLGCAPVIAGVAGLGWRWCFGAGLVAGVLACRHQAPF